MWELRWADLVAHATIETADVVIQDDMPSRIPMAINIGKQTKRIVWQNISSIYCEGCGLILGVAGLLRCVGSSFADIGVALLAILDAARIKNEI
ncbi:MAG: hypothetical protein IPN46_13400 [Saprospiraceae bacterium]|nr:hypothetical protein [Saprospiraceae bacterium]